MYRHVQGCPLSRRVRQPLKLKLFLAGIHSTVNTAMHLCVRTDVRCKLLTNIFLYFTTDRPHDRLSFVYMYIYMRARAAARRRDRRRDASTRPND